jgi:4-amino-4-deoxy-L-arabinose transferase-like glycosyltransferase
MNESELIGILIAGAIGMIVTCLLFAAIGAAIGGHKGRSRLGWAGIGLVCGFVPFGLGVIALIFLGFFVPSLRKAAVPACAHSTASKSDRFCGECGTQLLPAAVGS